MEKVNEINQRFKELRILCKKSQEEWGKVFGITKSGVSDIERGKRNVTKQHLTMLQGWKERRVNIDWLKTGEGEMFKEFPEEDETASIVSDLLEDGKNNPFYEVILEIMHTYNELSPKSQEVLRDASAKLLENLQKKKGD